MKAFDEEESRRMSDAHCGTLEAVCIAATAGALMLSHSRAQALIGRGLAGDRYEQGIGTFSGRFEVAAGARHVSIINATAVAECNARLGSKLTACDLRRNLVIRGLDLDALHGKVLAIGDVRLRVTGGCPPCGYLSRLLGVDVRQGLRHIGGVRASIIEGGFLRVGAVVHVIDVQERSIGGPTAHASATGPMGDESGVIEGY